VHSFVFNLTFCSGHEISDSNFGIFSPICLDVADFEVEKLFIEAGQEGEKEKLLTLEPEVTVCEVKSPSPSGRLSKHEEIFSASDESKSCESSDEE
jgi:hypothetical protein